MGIEDFLLKIRANFRYNVEDLTETILNNAETTIPAIFIPRKTKVQIVFPLNNRK